MPLQQHPTMPKAHPTLLQSKAPCKVPLGSVFPRHCEEGDEDPLWHKAWCGNSCPFQLPGFQSNLILKPQPQPCCKHLCYSFLCVALSYRVQGVRQTHHTAWMLIAWLFLPVCVFKALAFSSCPLAGSSYSNLLVERDEGGICLLLYYFSK